MRRISLDVKALWQTALGGAVFAAACYALMRYRPGAAWRLSDVLFAAGMLILCLSLYRLTRRLGMYDLVVYGYKKLRESLRRGYRRSESQLGDYADYLETASYTRPTLEPFLVALCYLVASAALMGLGL